MGWQRLLYRLKLLSVPEGEARKICQPLRRAFLQKMGLPPGTAAAAADSYVWMAEQDELAVERVLMLMRLLGGGGVPARAVGGAVRELQRYVGCGEPVLETKHMRCKCSSREWSSCTSSCTEARQGSTGKLRCESTCGWNGTWLGVLYRHFSNSRLSLEGGRGMPLLREEDKFLVDIVDTEEVDMVREGCRAAGVWRVSEVRGLDGAELREAAQSGGALERLVGRGKAGAKWGEVVRRVARARGGANDVMGRRVRVGAGSRSSKALGRWERTAAWDWSLVAWSVGGVIHLGIPQSGPGSRYLECRKLARTEGPPPKWMGRGTSQSALRRQLWRVEETSTQVDMKLTKVWDTSTERSRVQKGGVWPVEASCVMLEEGQRWLLDALPAELSEQVFMQLREQGQEHSLEGQQEWGCSHWKPGVPEEQDGTVCWKGESWSQQAAEECFAPGAELQLLGEGHDNMCSDMKWKQKLAEAAESNNWGVLDVYSDGGADGAGTPEASAEYGWMVGGTDEQSLETWAEGAARVGGLPEEMDSTRAELMGAYAVLHKVKEWEGTVRIWVDNDNVVRGLEKRLGVERADAVWARSEDWAGSTQEEGDSWRVQLGEGSDGDLWEAVDLLLERMQGKVEVSWIRGHADKTTTRRMMSKHQRGNVRADANCTAVKRGVRSRVRLPLPRRKSWRLCYDGVEMVGILRKELRDRMKTERLMRYFKETRGWGEEADRWLGEGVLAGWRMTSKAMHQRIAAVRMMFSMWLTEDVQVNRATKLTEAEKGVLSKCALCGQCAAGRRNEHLLFKCTDARVVEVRKEVEAAVERKVSRLVKPGPVKESIMVPWRLDSEGRPPDIGVVVEVEAAIGTVLGAATPAEGYRRLVSKQEAGSLIAGGSRSGTTGVHHQVHQPEEAAD